MDTDFLNAVNGDWDALLAAMRADPSVVTRTDSSGMTVLHWLCLHQEVPTDVLVKVVFANPRAVHTENDAGHIPLDLAEQAECDERVLEVLRAAMSAGEVFGEQPPVQVPHRSYQPQQQYSYEQHSPRMHDYELSSEYYQPSISPRDSHRYVPSADDRPRKFSTPELYSSSQDPRLQYNNQYHGHGHLDHEIHLKSMSMTDDQEGDLYPYSSSDDEAFYSRPMEHSQRDTRHQQQQMASVPEYKSKSAGPSQLKFPPRWTQARHCSVCHHPFTLLKRRHHCRNCGESVCSHHSTNRVSLMKFGLSDPQRVCDKCFLSGKHMAMSPSAASAGDYSAPSGQFVADRRPLPVSMDQRRFRSNSYRSNTFVGN